MAELSVDVNRQILGRIVRKAWVDYCRETGDTKPSHVAPWEELGEWDREADRRIGEAVVREVSKDAAHAVALFKEDLSAANERAERAEALIRPVYALIEEAERVVAWSEDQPLKFRQLERAATNAQSALAAYRADLAAAPRETAPPAAPGWVEPAGDVVR